MGKNSVKRYKLKTHKATAKRFKVTGTGKIKRKKAYKSHILTKKETKQKRRLTNKTVVRKEDETNIRLMLPHAF